MLNEDLIKGINNWVGNPYLGGGRTSSRVMDLIRTDSTNYWYSVVRLVGDRQRVNLCSVTT